MTGAYSHFEFFEVIASMNRIALASHSTMLSS